MGNCENHLLHNILAIEYICSFPLPPYIISVTDLVAVIVIIFLKFNGIVILLIKYSPFILVLSSLI